ncbi:MAG: NUDIX domain-containing protein [Cetobacterium sp.]
MKKQECVFLWLYCKNAKLYENYNDESIKDEENNLIFLQMRWDGEFGTVGGKVDEGESIKEALVREVKEEINYDLTEAEINKVEELAIYELEKYTIYSFMLEKTFEELISIRNNAVKAEHSISECNGYNLFRYNKELTAKKQLTKLPFSGSGLTEIIKLIDKMEETNEKENCN